MKILHVIQIDGRFYIAIISSHEAARVLCDRIEEQDTFPGYTFRSIQYNCTCDYTLPYIPEMEGKWYIQQPHLICIDAPQGATVSRVRQVIQWLID